MALILTKEGLFTSVQDLGGAGSRRFGIQPRGVMDRTAARLINLLLGNDDEAKVLEFHFPAPELLFETACRFSLGGADLSPELDGEPIANWASYEARESQVLRFRDKSLGSRCYLAVAGGLRIDEPHGPAFTTRPLKKGQRLLIDSPPSGRSEIPRRRLLSRTLLPAYNPFPTVRVIPGAEFSLLEDKSRSVFETAGFTLTNGSDRMGFRLSGPSLTLTRQTEMVSAAVNFGTIQLLPDGQMIILMADHQTTGGYPHIGHVISVDLPLAAQLGAGDKIAFKLVDIDEAERLSHDLEANLRRLNTAAGFGRYW